MPGRRRKIQRQVRFDFVLVFLVYCLDQLTKFWIIETFQQGSSLPVISNILHITLVRNTGAAFGIFSNYPHLFTGASVVAGGVVLFFLVWRRAFLSNMEITALCFVLGGTLGNLTDRLRVGYVIDFIDFRIWPVFNVADSFITIGALFLAWGIFSRSRR
jgi:signal peptidase II